MKYMQIHFSIYDVIPVSMGEVHWSILPVNYIWYPLIYTGHKLCCTTIAQRGAAAKYNRYSDVFREIVSNGGLRGLYCGIIPEYAKVRSPPPAANTDTV